MMGIENSLCRLGSCSKTKNTVKAEHQWLWHAAACAADVFLQVVPTGWPVFSMAWSSKHRILVAGGNSVMHIYKVTAAAAAAVGCDCSHCHVAGWARKSLL